MQREVRTVVSHVHQMQADMRQMLRLLVSNGNPSIPGGNPAQESLNNDYQDHHMMYASHDESHRAISMSVSRSFSVGDMAGIYQETSRIDEVNPVKAGTTGTATATVASSKNSPPSSSELTMARLYPTLPVDTEASPSEMMSSSIPSNLGIPVQPSPGSGPQPSSAVAGIAADDSNPGVSSADSRGLEINVNENEEELVPVVDMNEDPRLDTRRDAHLSSKSSKNTERFQSSESKESADTMDYKNSLQGESLENLPQEIVDVQSFSSEIDDNEDRSDNYHNVNFEDDVFQKPTASHRRPTYTGDHFWMSNSNEEVSPSDSNIVINTAEETIVDGNNDDDEVEEEEEEVIFLCPDLSMNFPLSRIISEVQNLIQEWLMVIL
jgi:hypothetical protein